MVTSLASHLLRVVLVALDAAGPSRARLAVRRLGLRLRGPVLFDRDVPQPVDSEARRVAGAGATPAVAANSASPSSAGPGADEGARPDAVL